MGKRQFDGTIAENVLESMADTKPHMLNLSWVAKIESVEFGCSEMRCVGSRVASEYAVETAPWELAFYAQAEVLSLKEALRRMGGREVLLPPVEIPGKTRPAPGGSVLSFGINILLRKGEKRWWMSIVWIGELKHKGQSSKRQVGGTPGSGPFCGSPGQAPLDNSHRYCASLCLAHEPQWQMEPWWDSHK